MNVFQRTKRMARTIALALAVSIGPLTAVTPAQTAPASACEVTWGSLVKTRAPHTSKQVTNIRSSHHQCFDRLVVDIDGNGTNNPGYFVDYVTRVTQDGSGANVPLRGDAKLLVVINAPAYDDHGRLTYRPDNRRELVDVTGYSTFRQVAWAGTFEGQTSIGLGVRAKLPMRAFVLDRPGGGQRVVVDVAHRW